ncbi:MAG TPA: hypothetical protein PL093_01850 [Candidatus Pacearchaeota archaeon]|jgi:hypothetical protein|nr:hypothetical protein [Candidatus Pacearchaeota archaeon]HRR94905.1 hypothetical protein [Candidatus Paceibacterota bacterium]HPC30547.1 hypothetical protein [Candidatus Pacearchaeota archaeon]HQG09372.1 hypothetical protein [Candidatus Pacearchaeota archaeon]HQH20302.1 hypothetical protein [Candidatus Pacearchaeota archaeon]
MNKKVFISFLAIGIIFCVLQIFKISFLSFFNIYFPWLDLTILLGLIICLFEEPKGLLGYFSAFWAGLFLDLIVSSQWFGFFTISFLLIALIIKIVLDKYVGLPSWQWLSKIQN